MKRLNRRCVLARENGEPAGVSNTRYYSAEGLKNEGTTILAGCGSLKFLQLLLFWVCYGGNRVAITLMNYKIR